jgi:hypothetical protein
MNRIDRAAQIHRNNEISGRRQRSEKEQAVCCATSESLAETVALAFRDPMTCVHQTWHLRMSRYE